MNKGRLQSRSLPLYVSMKQVVYSKEHRNLGYSLRNHWWIQGTMYFTDLLPILMMAMEPGCRLVLRVASPTRLTELMKTERNAK